MKEYRVETLGGSDYEHERKLNEWAQEGWRCISVTKTLTGAYYTFYLEREKPETNSSGSYPYKRSW